MAKRGKYKLVKDNPTKFKPLHGHTTSTGYRSPTYRSWESMKGRCARPTMENYPRYGGAGVTVCAEWLDFSTFLRDMGVRPDGHTLDRKDSTKGYSKDNCRWATPKQQAANRRRRVKHP